MSTRGADRHGAEARFEDPAGGPALVVRSVHGWRQNAHAFHSPPVKGVTADRDYQVELRLLAPAEGAKTPTVLATYTKSFRSDLDQAVLPETPLAPGPGYHRKVQPGQ